MSNKMLLPLLVLVPAALMAGPPGPPSTPLTVTVANPVLQVEVANAEPIPVQPVAAAPAAIWHDSFSGSTSGTGGDSTGLLDIFPAGALLTTISVSINTSQMPETPYANCVVELTLSRGGSQQDIFRAIASPAGAVNQVIPFADIPVGGGRILLETDPTNAGVCYYSVNLYAKVPAAE